MSSCYQSYFPEIYREEPIQTRQLIYGCLFDHISSSELATPEFIASHCRRGRWLYQHECERYFPEKESLWIMPKSLWPVPFQLVEDILLESWSPEALIDRATMVRLEGYEVPYFVVPSHYPECR